MFSLGKPLKRSVMFGGKARSRPESGESEGCFTRVGFGLSRKLYTRLERLARDNTLACYEHSQIMDVKSFTNLDSGQIS